MRSVLSVESDALLDLHAIGTGTRLDLCLCPGFSTTNARVSRQAIRFWCAAVLTGEPGAVSACQDERDERE